MPPTTTTGARGAGQAPTDPGASLPTSASMAPSSTWSSVPTTAGGASRSRAVAVVDPDAARALDSAVPPVVEVVDTRKLWGVRQYLVRKAGAPPGPGGLTWVFPVDVLNKAILMQFEAANAGRLLGAQQRKRRRANEDSDSEADEDEAIATAAAARAGDGRAGAE
jgi:hypothetical protein